MVITKCYSEIKTNCHFTINLLYIPDCLANFKIDKKIGKGQFSEVYRAINKIDGSVVALKKVQVGHFHFE
jgi:serine/threonine protein kinase